MTSTDSFSNFWCLDEFKLQGTGGRPNFENEPGEKSDSVMSEESNAPAECKVQDWDVGS